MDGQMSIFDMNPVREVDIESTPLPEIVQIISEALGIPFHEETWEYNDLAEGFTVQHVEYVARPSKSWKLTIDKDHFYVDPDDEEGVGEAYIGCGWDFKEQGAGAPCKSVGEAVEWFRKIIKRAKEAVKDDYKGRK